MLILLMWANFTNYSGSLQDGLVRQSELAATTNVDRVDIRESELAQELVVEPAADPVTSFWTDPAFVQSDGKLRFAGYSDSVYPDSPLDVYESHINAANSGNTESMFAVYRALRDCGSVRDGTFEELGKEYLQKTSEPNLVRQFNTRMEQCIPLRDVAGNIEQQEVYWQKRLFEAEHPVIVANSVFTQWLSFGGTNDEIGLQLRENVIAAAATDSVSGYDLLVSYLATIFPAEHNLEREAWSVLSCRRSRSCNVSDIKRTLEQQYHAHDLLTIEQLATEYRSAVESGEIEPDLLPLPYWKHGQPEHY